ncbi:PulJ/GspJ family protein [Pseudolysinimonas sp.]|uniref:PulJ/GspJ family protein n=1 Tax=Pseudolysinimonas sp. TaxID=2680009 RepID=UPI003F810113
MIVRIARRLRRSERGITLVELMVSSALGLLILVTAGGLLVSVTRASGVQASSDVNTRGATTAMNTMSRYFHAATTYPTAGGVNPALANMSPTDVTFYAYVNLVNTASQPVKVRYYVDATSKNLIEQLYPSTCSATTGYCTFSSTFTQINLGGAVASPTSDGSALFVYLTAAGVPTADAASVQSVQINLEYGSSTAGTPGDTHLSNTVAMFNVGQFGGTTS